KKGVIHDIPRNLKELGYQINEKGQFLTLKGEIYNFEVKERAYNEALYDVIIGAENNEFVTYEVIDRVFEHVAKKLEQLENGATESNDENEEDIEDEYLNEPSFFQNTIIDDVQDKVAY
ncbi:20222_t:CDS:2, partial [Entrophospora sp. SA101]